MHPTRIFRSPDELELAFKAYTIYLEEEAKNWLKIQYVGKEGERMADALKLPYTFDGFCVFCYKNYGTVHQYFENKDGLYTDFVGICSYIKQEIRANQITGGLLGVYNPSITQRLNSLVEKVEDVTPQAPKKLIIKVNRRNNEDS
jgi:hypothetical protein